MCCNIVAISIAIVIIVWSGTGIDVVSGSVNSWTSSG